MAGEDYLIRIQLQVQNDKALKRLTTELDKAAKQAPKAGKAMRQATVGTKRFGNVAQNAGYQIQDMVVQIQGGVAPMRAMSQQLPQMLVGFGAWGAAIGVVTALLPTLITLAKGTDEVIADLGTSVGDLSTALSGMASFTSAIDFNSWNEEWNKATESVRQTELALLKFRVSAAQGNLTQAVAAGAKEINGELSTTQKALAWISDWFNGVDNSAEILKDINVAEAMGVNRGTVDQLQAIFAEFEAGTKTAAEMRDAMLGLAGEITDANPELYQYVESMHQLAKATEDLARARTQVDAASQGGLLPVTGGGGGGGGAPSGDPSDPYNLGFDTSIFKQAPVWLKEIEALDAGISDFGESAAEGFNLAAEGSEIFLRSFDSAADGVARGTQSMSDAFESMTKSILLQIGKLLAIRGIGTALSGQGGFLGELGASLLASGQGNAFSGGHHLTAYAKGGVVSGPTLFPMAKGAGLMGEAGPEAVLPLTRMSNGNLGVESSGMNVTINNNASGVSVRPRQTDEGLTIDVVMDAVSQAITRGGNDVSQSIENSYALNRGRAVYGN